MSVRAAGLALAAAGATLAGVPAASGGYAKGVAKVGLGVVGPQPTNANLYVGEVLGAASGARAAGDDTPRLAVRSGRKHGVVVVYGIRRTGGRKPHFQVVVFALRGKGGASSSTAASKIKMRFETPGGDAVRGRRLDEVNDVVGDNPEPEHAMLNLGKFDFRTAAGRFRGDDGGARASARHDIALNALFARNLYREAFNDESYAGRARFMRDMESCCTDD